jgi:hypothetical protein
VKRRDGEARVAPPKTVGDTLAQVARRFARERQNKEVLRPSDLVLDQPDGAFDDDSRLPGPGASQHDRRAFAMCDSRVLVAI